MFYKCYTNEWMNEQLTKLSVFCSNESSINPLLNLIQKSSQFKDLFYIFCKCSVWIFKTALSWYTLWNLYHYQVNEWIRHPQKFTHVPLTVTPSCLTFLPISPQDHFLFSITIYWFSFSNFVYMASYRMHSFDWSHSLSLIVLNCIHVVACIDSLFFLSAE